MEANWWIDLESKPCADDESNQPLAEPMQVRWVRLLFRALHALRPMEPGAFALALPEYKAGDFKILGRKVRVFAEDRAVLEELQHGLESDPWLARRVVFKSIRKVDPDFSGPWVAFTRIRAPRRNKMRPALFMQRLDEIKRLPSVMVSSASTRQVYPLAIDRMVRTEKPAEISGYTGGFGLSTPAAPLFLPDLPTS